MSTASTAKRADALAVLLKPAPAGGARRPHNMLGFEPSQQADRAPRVWPKFMTARVAADYSDSSPWTIRRHVRPCGRRGRTLVYAIESVEEWMRGESLTVASPSNDAPAYKSRSTVTRGSAVRTDRRSGAASRSPSRGR
jgi:hypothetical protein